MKPRATDRSGKFPSTASSALGLKSDAESKLPVLKEFPSLEKIRKPVRIIAFLTPGAGIKGRTLGLTGQSLGLLVKSHGFYS